MAHRLDKVIVLLCADTADLRELALIAGRDPRTFYHGIDPEDLDLAGQDVEGIEFTDITFERIEEIRRARAKGERLAMLIDMILQDRSRGLEIIERYAADVSAYANRSLNELRNALKKETDKSRIDNVSLVRAIRRPLSHQLGDSRASLLYHLAKHLSKYPDIKLYLRKSWAKSSSREFDRYRQQISKLLE